LLRWGCVAAPTIFPRREPDRTRPKFQLRPDPLAR
jgi:hypothetical protein